MNAKPINCNLYISPTHAEGNMILVIGLDLVQYGQHLTLDCGARSHKMK
jgi:hypothetical protein